MHRTHLAKALDLAAQCQTLTSPNPHVGCVLAGPYGNILGQGHTQRAGGHHAEIMALREAQSRHQSVRGATAYVTLEPCAHHGRTAPCCDALIEAGISKVIATHVDPNPLVAGQGFERLREAGVQVEVLPSNDPLAVQSREINIGFFSRMIRNTPWVRMKIAASLDGRTALDNGISQWITSDAARADGHAWRARSCAVLTGIGTMLADNPKLDVRLLPTRRQPGLVVVDSHLKTPLDAHLFGIGRALWIWAAGQNEAKKAALEALGAQVLYRPDGAGQVDLAGMLQDLAEREINELHVEAGHKLNGSLIRAGLVDEYLIYLAPKMLGQGLGMTNLGPFTQLSDVLELRFHSVEPVGADLRIVARAPGREAF